MIVIYTQSSHVRRLIFREHYEDFLSFCLKINKIFGYKDYDVDYSILSDFKPSDLEQMMDLGVKYSGLGSYFEPVEITNETFVQDYVTRDLCCGLAEYSISNTISTSWATATIAAAEAALKAVGRQDMLSVTYLLKCLPELYEIRPNDVTSNDIIHFVKEYGLISLSMAMHLAEDELCTAPVFTYKFDFSRPEVPNKSGLMNLVAEGDPVVVLMALDLLRLRFVTNVGEDKIFTGATSQPSVYGVLYGYDPNKWMVSLNVVPCETIYLNLPVKDSETNANYAGIAAYAFSVKAQPLPTEIVVDDSYVDLSTIPSWVTKLTFSDNSFNSTEEVVITNLTHLHILIFGNNSFANTVLLIIDAPELEEIVFYDGCFSGMGGVIYDGATGKLEINCPLMKKNILKEGSLLNFDKVIVNHLSSEFQLSLGDYAADKLSMIERSSAVDYTVIHKIINEFEDKKGYKGYIRTEVFDVALIDLGYTSSGFDILSACFNKSNNYTCLLDFLDPDYTALPSTLFPTFLPEEDVGTTEPPTTLLPSGDSSLSPEPPTTLPPTVVPSTLPPTETPSITDSPIPYPTETPTETPSVTDSPIPYPTEAPSTLPPTEAPTTLPPTEAPSITDSPIPYPTETPSVTDSPVPYPTEFPTTLPPTEAPTTLPPTETPSITDSPVLYPTEAPTEAPSVTDSPIPYPTETPSITWTPLPSFTSAPEYSPDPSFDPSIPEEGTSTPTPLPLDIIENCYEFLTYPTNSTYLIVADDACNDKTIPSFDLDEYDDLEIVQIGDNNFKHTDSFVIEDLDKLESIQIGMNSFAKEKNSTMSDSYRIFHIQNCTHLKTIEIDVYSFNDYAGSFLLVELPELESLSIGVIGSDSYNFYSASFTARGIITCSFIECSASQPEKYSSR